ncbi:Fasciclin-like arabinogalactan family protein [Rhynchospora pubera]|uniref:Fasciclin-like arabinogalactan family protein n=1 Tax=Rhynchospora pubera TaxID=906938 RepID=A0AAV8CPT2_9POAL|nr:Fasciclin-like arabinogalactan family protein [Rhynchospora pubera]
MVAVVVAEGVNLSLSICLLAFLVLLHLATSQAPAPPPFSPPFNITHILLDARDFNVAASALQASGVASQFEEFERGVGITLFVPTDLAFASSTNLLRSLPAEKKSLVLKFHALHSYYPLGSLQSIVNPVQPTLATEDTAAGLFTLNITRLSNGSSDVSIATGLVQASITRTVFDQNPLAIFAVSNVLLPKDLFNHTSHTSEAAPPAVQLAGTAPGPGADGRAAVMSVGTGTGQRIDSLFWLLIATGLIYLVRSPCLC